MGRCVSFHRFAVWFCLALWLSAGVCGSVRAAAFTRTQPLSAEALPSAAVPSARQSTPFAPPQATKKGEYTLSHERYEKAVSYSRASYTMYFVSVGLNILALAVFLRLGIAARFRDWAESVSDKRWVQALVFVPLLVLTVDVVALPLRIYGHILSLRYEMSVQGWGSWTLDWGKEQVLMAGFGLIFALILSALIPRSPRRWWLYLWFAALPVVMI